MKTYGRFGFGMLLVMALTGSASADSEVLPCEGDHDKGRFALIVSEDASRLTIRVGLGADAQEKSYKLERISGVSEQAPTRFECTFGGPGGFSARYRVQDNVLSIHKSAPNARFAPAHYRLHSLNVPATLVLVHGALFNGDSWMPVQAELRKAGIRSVAVHLPGRRGSPVPASQATFENSVEALCQTVREQPGPVVLAGHSQGGAIITQAFEVCGDQVQSYVYIAAVAPRDGEGVFDDLSAEDGESFERSAKLDATEGVWRAIDISRFVSEFMPDANRTQAQMAWSSVVPEPVQVGEGKLAYDPGAFALVPKYYVGTELDRIISPATQSRIRAKHQWKGEYRLPSGHLPMMTKPTELSDILVKIVEAPGLQSAKP